MSGPVYRLLQQQTKPHAVQRADSGVARILPQAELERYLELVAAIKLHTSNRQGRHLSVAGAIRLLEDYGVETSHGFVQAPKGVLKIPTVNRYLKQWGYDHTTLLREPPAVRFQARYQAQRRWPANRFGRRGQGHRWSAG